jgi:hypothetical protein
MTKSVSSSLIPRHICKCVITFLNIDLTVCLVCNSFDRASGYWDKGPRAIIQFLREHQCNTVCRQLELHGATETVPGIESPTGPNPMS